MAEKGAHLTSVTQINPSIFDCMAQETLNDLLRPSVQKIVKVLAIRNPIIFKFEKWFDEFYFLSYLLVQYYHLKKHAATFSEKFYGLKRERLKISKDGSLGRKELIWSLLGVVLFPYLQTKLNDFAEKILLDEDSRVLQDKKKKVVVYSNSALNIFYKGIQLIQYVRYLSGKTDIASPLLWTAGVKLKYSEDRLRPTENFTLKSFSQDILEKTLGIVAFFIQFRQWWETEKSSSGGLIRVPPPPRKSKKGITCDDKCPICRKNRNMDTVLSTSGYVFCFQCISSFLMKNNYCPVTKLPATVDNLIYIYSPS